MSPPVKSRFWRRARLTFRWLRIMGWLALLTLICGLLYLNRHGLPGFIQQRLLAELRAQGLDVASSRIRLRWYRGIVAESVRLAQANPGPNPHLAAGELVLRPDWRALLGRTFRLRGIVLSQGRVVLPVSATNAPLREVVIEGLHAQVDFLEGDRWQLSGLDGAWRDVRFHFSGVLSNAPALLEWKGGDSAVRRQRAEFWSQVVTRLEQVRFIPSASLKGTFMGDARHPEASSAAVELAASGLVSPWGTGQDAVMSLVVRSQSNAFARLEWVVRAEKAQTRWGQARGLRVDGQADLPFSAPKVQNVRLSLTGEAFRSLWGQAGHLGLEADAAILSTTGWAEDSRVTVNLRDLRSRWGEAAGVEVRGTLKSHPTNAALAQGVYALRCTNVQGAWIEASRGLLVAEMIHRTANFQPLSARTRAELDQAVFKQGDSSSNRAGFPGRSSPAVSASLGQAKSVRVGAVFSLPAEAGPAVSGTNFWRLATFNHAQIDANAGLVSLQGQGAEFDRLDLVARWRAPVLLVEPATAILRGGQINATARLDTATRELTAGLVSDVDPLRLARLFATNSEPWSNLAIWEQAPKVQASLKLVLPAWTNRAHTWAQEALSTLVLATAFQTGPGTIRSIPCHGAAWESPPHQPVVAGPRGADRSPGRPAAGRPRT